MQKQPSIKPKKPTLVKSERDHAIDLLVEAILDQIFKP
jgi:hypothetical protein